MPRRELSRLPSGAGPRRLAWGTAGLLLTAFFVVRGFPSERLAAALSAALARSGPLALEIQALGPSLSILGPGLRATGVRLSAPDGPGIRVDALQLRPAWSLCWLRLRPCFRLAAELAGGSVDGTLGVEPSFAGEIEGIELAQLPIAALWPGAELAGKLDAAVDLRASAQGPEGGVALSAREGSVTLPHLPLPLPFDSLQARVALGGDAMLRLEELQLSGPGLEARGEGRLGHAEAFAEAPLDLRVALEAESQAAEGLRRLGLRLDRDGRGSLHLTGTPSRPRVE
jgi:type II secretion system protein N